MPNLYVEDLSELWLFSPVLTLGRDQIPNARNLRQKSFETLMSSNRNFPSKRNQTTFLPRHGNLSSPRNHTPPFHWARVSLPLPTTTGLNST